MRRLVIASAVICALAVLLLSACSENTSPIDNTIDPLGTVQVLEFQLNSDPTAPPVLISDEKAVVSVTLEQDNALLIVPAADLGDATVITKFTLFKSDAGTKGEYVGVWTRDNPADQPVPTLTIGAQGVGVTVDNANATEADQRYFFAVTAVIDGTEYDSDPELTVKKNVGG